MCFSVKGVKSRMMWCTVICRKKGRKEDTKTRREEEARRGFGLCEEGGHVGQ
jgi:hypothetical protein